MNPSNSNSLSSTSRVQFWQIEADQEGQRLDNYLIARLKGVPKTHIYRLVRKGEVRVNKKRADVSQRLQVDDVVRIPPVRMAESQPKPVASNAMKSVLETAILYEDDALLVLNKPAGWAVHGGSGIRLGVIESLRQLREHAQRWELVHRLDRDTSGCLIVAKKPSIMKKMQADWGGFKKQYLALVSGHWLAKDVWVDAPLLKNVLQSGERVVRVSAEGKAALSEFSLLKTWPGVSQVAVHLHTGRTHQIRVHAQWKKHPLLGDDKYADTQAVQLAKKWGVKRLMLHAQCVSFAHPISGETLTVEAPLADDIQQVIQRLNQLTSG